MTTNPAHDLAAALDELEAVAKACEGRPWGTQHGAVVFDGATLVAQCDDPVTGRHIAIHDPAAVLRRVAADRKILALHEDGRSGKYVEPWCVTCSEDEYLEYLPCDTIRALAEGLGVEL